MLRIGQVEPSATADGKYTDGSVAGGIAATRLRAAAFNAMQEELANIVESAGMILSPDDMTQVLTALKKQLLSRANPFADIKADGPAAVAAALSNLGLTAALANKQPLDATLTALAGLVNGANKLPYFTGTDTMGVADLSAFVRPMLGKDDATAILSYLGLGQASTTKSGIVKLSSRADSTSETEAATPKAISDLHAVIDVLLPKRVFAENDYIRIPDQPGGLILQWGTSTTALKNNFPVPFTNVCLKVFQIPQSNDSGPHGLIYHQVLSTDRFSFTRPAGVFSVPCFYFAIGY